MCIYTGHMVRGRFCTSIVTLLFDGLKLQKLGFVQQDVWKVIGAFCQEGVLIIANTSSCYELMVMLHVAS